MKREGQIQMQSVFNPLDFNLCLQILNAKKSHMTLPRQLE
jgi:hypothetical protein